ncbi:MAG TPA: prephenate dehydratase domain-containing protein [archaeon]|nr:prephenate dehydratase domain-containing protein [archaeon]
MKIISHLGPKNTYTGQATRMLAERIEEETELVDLASLEAVARSVALHEADMGVMAYYNYLEGLVQECLDLIYENDLKITGMQRLPIVLSLGAHSENHSTAEVYSHPKALAQCSGWLWDHYRDSKQIPTTSTAAAAQRVAEAKSGLAIASSEALKKYGLDLVGEDIGNKRYGRTNFTDFYLVARENGCAFDKTREYLTMVAITPHVDRPGLLAEILQQTAYHNLNNVKIHSRPALDDVAIEGLEPQMFYLEVVGHRNNDDMRRCIDSLRYKMKPEGRDIEVVRVLGSYERP